MSGIFITFEGGDGVGKSTNIAFLEEKLKGEGYEVVKVREPGGTKIGEAIREMLLSNDNAEMSDETELFLYEAARSQIVSEVIRPALDRGAVVLCDRFYDSTTAYQAYGRGIDKAFVVSANVAACRGLAPDRTIVLHQPAGAKAALERAKQTGEPDRIESAGIDFHNTVDQAFIEIAKDDPDRVRLVEVTSIEDTAAAVFEAVSDLFGWR